MCMELHVKAWFDYRWNLLKKGDSLKVDVIGEDIEVNPVDAKLKRMFSSGYH